MIDLLIKGATIYDGTGNETKIKAAMTNAMFTWLAPYLISQ